MAKGLSRAVLGRAALAIVDADGVGALSMRRLARVLDVDPMAAYRHLDGKDALVDAVVETILAEADLTELGEEPWARLETRVRRVYAAVAAHPQAASLLSARQWLTPAGLAIIDGGLADLAAAGIEAHEASLAMNATGLFLVGLAQAAGGGDGRRAAAIDLSATPALAANLAAGGQITDYAHLLDFWLATLKARLAR